MTFSPSTRTLSGTPPRGISSFSIRIKARDSKYNLVYDDFVIKINNKPNLNTKLIDQKWNEAKASSYVFSSTAFGDIDKDTLTYTALQSSGSALPAWIKFNPTTLTFSGTPLRGVASYTIRVTAKDPKGLSVYDVIHIQPFRSCRQNYLILPIKALLLMSYLISSFLLLFIFIHYRNGN